MKDIKEWSTEKKDRMCMYMNGEEYKDCREKRKRVVYKKYTNFYIQLHIFVYKKIVTPYWRTIKIIYIYI